jgi:hypothetical protein
LGFCPQETNCARDIHLFPKKEAKSIGPLRGKPWSIRKSAKPTQGGLGACPQEKIAVRASLKKPVGLGIFFFFQKKKQKAFVRFAEDHGLTEIRRSQPRGGWGLPQEKISESFVY